LVEGKKETLCFSGYLNLFNIQDATVFVTKGRCALVWRISDYASKGRHILRGMHLLLAIKVGVSLIPYKARQALEWHERFNDILKSFLRNQAYPEGSMIQ
jgi:hypothetical protein